MRTRVTLSLVLWMTAPVWCQTATEGASPATAALMQTPPPVSGEAYSIEVGPERSNYLHAGLVFSTAYNDNILAGTGTHPVADTSYSISPTIALDQTTARLHQTLEYRPGFTFYQHTSELNEQDQILAWNLQYRLSPHTTAIARDSFQKSSNVFGQPYSFLGGAVSGATPSSLTPVVAPIADQLWNVASAELTHQFSRNGMAGASGVFTNLHYFDPTQVPGLSDSNSHGGSAFLSYRPARSQYLGATYQYSQIVGTLPGTQSKTQNGIESEIQTHAVLFFLTSYLKSGLSFSVSGGPQYYDVSQASFPPERSWVPAVAASMGWQSRRASFAASYARLVSGGGGLIGAFNSNMANISARWQIARTWTVGPLAGYTLTKNVSPSMSQLNPGGHMVFGTMAVEHPIHQRLLLEFGYTRLHQSYSSIAAISSAPDTNREYFALSYQFTRPLGR